MLRNTGYISGESHNRELNGMCGAIGEAKEAEKYLTQAIGTAIALLLDV